MLTHACVIKCNLNAESVLLFFRWRSMFNFPLGFPAFVDISLIARCSKWAIQCRHGLKILLTNYAMTQDQAQKGRNQTGLRVLWYTKIFNRTFPEKVFHVQFTIDNEKEEVHDRNFFLACINYVDVYKCYYQFVNYLRQVLFVRFTP